MSTPSYQTFQVPSSGRLGVVHTVTVFADGVTDCTCEDSRYRRRQCRHQRFVLATYTTAGRSGALIEAAQTGRSVAAEHDLKRTEASGVTLGTLIAERNAAETDLAEVRKITGAW